MTGTETCRNCQSEFPCEVGFVGKYKVVYGWCSECNQARIIWQNEAYEDDDFNVHSESDKIGKMLYDNHYRGFKIIDTPDYQFKWTDMPTKEHRCSSCIHGYRKIVDGEDTGQSCRIGKSPDYDYDEFVNRCTDYRALDTWNNMGGHCRHCLFNCQNDCLHKGNLKEVSDYAKGHCEHYRASTIWGFERIGFTSCPECHLTASITRYGKVVCESCNESWNEKDLEESK